VAISARWLLPWFCLVLISTGFAYWVSAVLCSAQPTAAAAATFGAASFDQRTSGVPSRPFLGTGIEPAHGAQTSIQLEAAELPNPTCDAAWIALAPCFEQAP